jgi:hypothetical protein
MNASVKSLCKLPFFVNFHSSAVADLSATNKDSCLFGIATNPSGLSISVSECWSICLPSIEKYFGTTNNLFSIEQNYQPHPSVCVLERCLDLLSRVGTIFCDAPVLAHVSRHFLSVNNNVV